jgi:hypothetical protein
VEAGLAEDDADLQVQMIDGWYWQKCYEKYNQRESVDDYGLRVEMQSILTERNKKQGESG